MEVVAFIWKALFIAWLLLVLISDLFLYTIPNRYVIFGLAISLGSQLFYFGASGLLMWPLNGLLPSIMLYFFYALGMLGAGDVKLGFVIGSFYGCNFGIYVNILSLLPAAILSLFLCLWRGNLFQRLHVLAAFISQCKVNKKVMKYTKSVNCKGGRMPFGACMCVTAICLNLAGDSLRKVMNWLKMLL